ncbi:unnamed protein product, partial [marine sediment metagenome]
LSLIPIERGTLMESWIDLLETVVGWGVWLMPVAFAVLGLWLVFMGLGREWKLEPGRLWGALALFVLGLALLHLIAGGDDAEALAAGGGGGGYLGYLLSQLLASGLGTPGAVLVLVTLSLVGLVLALGLSVGDMWAILSESVRASLEQIRRPKLNLGRLVENMRPEETVAPNRGPTTQTRPRPQGSVFPRIIGGNQPWQLPPVDEILESAKEQELSQAEIRERVRIIEETLASFGVPAKVVEVNQGPTITQFGVEPGYIERRSSDGRVTRSKIKVSKI